MAKPLNPEPPTRWCPGPQPAIGCCYRPCGSLLRRSSLPPHNAACQTWWTCGCRVQDQHLPVPLGASMCRHTCTCTRVRARWPPSARAACSCTVRSKAAAERMQRPLQVCCQRVQACLLARQPHGLGSRCLFFCTATAAAARHPCRCPGGPDPAMRTPAAHAAAAASSCAGKAVMKLRGSQHGE